MTKIAIDVALIPPDKILDLLIDLNANMVEKSPDFFNLGKKDYLPHITIAMGVVEEESLEEIQRRVIKITEMHSELSLTLMQIDSSQKEDLTWSSSADIFKSEELLKLHVDIIDSIKEFFLSESSPDMFYALPKPADNSNALNWVKNYAHTSTYDNFQPHISLGKGRVQDSKLLKSPLSFRSHRLIISHLGTHCTCRKILFEKVLKKNLA